MRSLARTDTEPALQADEYAPSVQEAHGNNALPLYLQIATQITSLVAKGVFNPGQRLPSVRDTATQNTVAVSTAVQAFHYLEEHGLVQARSKAGYFVVTGARGKASRLLMKIGKPLSATLAFNRSAAQQSNVLTPPTASDRPSTIALRISFGGYCPKDGLFFDMERIRSALNRAARTQRHSLLEYSSDQGTLALRRAVAQRALHMGCALDAEHIVTTASCIQAVTMCLQAVTKPGDMVVVESPTFFGFLDLLESLSLRALPIPTHPRSGISLPALELALDTQPVRAMLLVPTLSNPLGAVMPLASKRALAHLARERQIPLIEDAVFNDLMASDARRKAVKAFDTEGWVMLCGSFAKTTAPGIRIGWVDGGRWQQRIASLKRIQGVATNAVLEHALADLLTHSSFEAHLRRLYKRMADRLGQARQIIQTHFPLGTAVNNPPAGYTLWVQLPQGMNSMALFSLCYAQGIMVGPGALFCASQRYSNCLRLSFAGKWGQSEQEALVQVGQLACALEKTPSLAPNTAQDGQSRMQIMCIDEVSAYDLW